MKRNIIILIVILLINILPAEASSNTVMTVSDVSCPCGTSIEVPITISGNTGIAGAVVKVSYDTDLILTSVNNGDAFDELVFTPPAKLSSNPFTLLWDGVESDNSNGTIATLVFTAPNNAGTFDINLSYDIGGIYDGDLNDIDVLIENGSITTYSDAGTVPEMNVSDDGTYTVTITSPNTIDGDVYVAVYDEKHNMIEANIQSADTTVVPKLTKLDLGEYVKVMWWESETLTPFCEEVIIQLH